MSTVTKNRMSSLLEVVHAHGMRIQRGKKRIVTSPKQTPGIISSATADLDGDGNAEIAIAFEFSMNEPTKGKLLVASQGPTLDDPWNVAPVADVPSIHRLRWGMFYDFDKPRPGKLIDFERRIALAVGPIFGRSAKPPIFNQAPAEAVLFYPGAAPKSGKWRRQPIGKTPVLHAIDVVDFDSNGVDRVLGASNDGVTGLDHFTSQRNILFNTLPLIQGADGDAPKKGCSEVHVGRLKDGRRFLATVEPWHGTQVAVYLEDTSKALKFGQRNLIDSSLKEGHALWVADVDGDGDSEIFAGYRGQGTSVLMFDFDGKTWNRTVIDDKIAAQDLRGGDLDGDGTPDVVAVGGSTKNVVWYRPKRLNK